MENLILPRTLKHRFLAKIGFKEYIGTAMNDREKYISINSDIRFGKPCITGTRIAIADTLQWPASGMSNEDILQNYPELDFRKIRAALAFAAHREEIGKIVAA